MSGCKGNGKRSRRTYRLVDVFEELAGRELYFIIKSRGLRNDRTAIRQLCEAWLVASINLTNRLLTL